MLAIAERNEMLNTISDLTKAAYGFRVRRDYSELSDSDLQAEWDYYLKVAERRAAEERDAEAAAIKLWQGRMARMMDEHGIDLATAVRWDMQASDCDHGGWDYYIWDNGINFEEGRKIGIKIGCYQLEVAA